MYIPDNSTLITGIPSIESDRKSFSARFPWNINLTRWVLIFLCGFSIVVNNFARRNIDFWRITIVICWVLWEFDPSLSLVTLRTSHLLHQNWNLSLFILITITQVYPGSILISTFCSDLWVSSSALLYYF